MHFIHSFIHNCVTGRYSSMSSIIKLIPKYSLNMCDGFRFNICCYCNTRSTTVHLVIISFPTVTEEMPCFEVRIATNISSKAQNFYKRQFSENRHILLKQLVQNDVNCLY